MSHLHHFDVHPDPARAAETFAAVRDQFVYCLECGAAIPGRLLRSQSSLDAIVARRHATPAALALLGIDRDGNITRPPAGYQIAPNNIYRLRGVELVPDGPGVLEPIYGQELRAIGDRFVILQRTYAERRVDHVTIARFTDWPEVVEWLRHNGRPSEGGQSHIPGRFIR